LCDALVDADLLIEAIPERLGIKRAFYTRLQVVAPVKTIFASNSSTMLPSQLAASPSRQALQKYIDFMARIMSLGPVELVGPGVNDPFLIEVIQGGHNAMLEFLFGCGSGPPTRLTPVRRRAA
jgi:3-hydroxyacyl-CoA dehydrogenase